MLVDNFRPKSPCKCPNFATLVAKHKAQLVSKHNTPNSDSIQDRHGTTNDNIPVTFGKAQAQAQKWARKQQTHTKINMRSDWSDSDNGKDNQGRGKPIVYDITSN